MAWGRTVAQQRLSKIIQKICDEHPNKSRQEICRLFNERIKGDETLIHDLAAAVVSGISDELYSRTSASVLSAITPAMTSGRGRGRE